MTDTAAEIERVAEAIRARAGRDPVALGVVLGSGLSHLASAVEGPAIPFADLLGFPRGGVSGHGSALHVGHFEGQRVAVLAGREHYYEHGRPDAMRRPLEVLRALGAARLYLTNAAGSLRPDMPTGSIMCLSDHINFSGLNPLIGEPTDARFVPMGDAHDPGMRAGLIAAAAAEGVTLHQGVYAWYSGPSFETPAEIRAIRMLGADAVGMSTVPEVILGRFLGLRVAAVSVITNMAAGMSAEPISHAHTKAMAPIGAARLERVLRRHIREM